MSRSVRSRRGAPRGIGNRTTWKARKQERSARQSARREVRSLRDPEPFKHRHRARWDAW